MTAEFVFLIHVQTHGGRWSSLTGGSTDLSRGVVLGSGEIKAQTVPQKNLYLEQSNRKGQKMRQGALGHMSEDTHALIIVCIFFWNSRDGGIGLLRV